MMMSNFQFLSREWTDIYSQAVDAEKLVAQCPQASVIIARSTLETTLNWLYINDADLQMPYDQTLSSMIHDYRFKSILKPAELFTEINIIRKIGNAGAHGDRIKLKDSISTIKYLFRFLSFFAVYYSEKEPQIHPFDVELIPKSDIIEQSQKEIKKLSEKLNYKNEHARKELLEKEKLAQENHVLKQQLLAKENEIKSRKIQRETTIDPDISYPRIVSEAETRKRFIDFSLKESGWINLRDGYELEYEVKGMPHSTNPSGTGYADYVLWGDNGLPLMVIEAKRTTEESRKGRYQAELYADCLENMYGQRPLIYYTNGFETYLWDDCFSIDRKVDGFYTKDEAQLQINRRSTRLDLRQFTVNTEIAGRPYQLEALKRIAENFVIHGKDGKLREKSRQALLVMATGSGKTRTSAAIVDMMTKCNWAKRILFLADRNALVSQAKLAFSNYLPHIGSIDLTKEKEDKNTRLVFSTYPTMMNRIDSNRSEDQRFYGVGHFDLIIVDEAHRSVYQKYKAIFDHFDSYLIGLTATPKRDIDKNTYELFGIENDIPTYAYELTQAVADNFLVPPKAISVPLKFQREGIKYSELSEKEKQEYEEKFGDFTDKHDEGEIHQTAINQWLFNKDTVDKVLDFLMTHGIKVQGGDKLGKTIIFAKNHNHARFIQDRFNINYPEYGGKFLNVIDNQEKKAQYYLERFKDEYEEVDPQIAVSVDMMDTGVDAPRVVNLVFFKMVKSYAKFWQMVGRGTRLCPNLFGPNEDKSHFVIFDYCQNFEFFEANPDGVVGDTQKPLTEQIFQLKLEVAFSIRNLHENNDSERELAEQYINELHQDVEQLDRSRFQVKKYLRYVEEFSKKQRWESLSKSDVIEIQEHLAKLILPKKSDDELARRFDILILNYQLAVLVGKTSTKHFKEKIYSTAKSLAKKVNIPAVKEHAQLLNELSSEIYWKDVNILKLDRVGNALRHLIRFIDKEKQEIVYTNFKDHIEEGEEKDIMSSYTSLQSYRDRVELYVRKNKHHTVIQKLRTNQPVTQTEINTLEHILFSEEHCGTKEEYIKEYGNRPLGTFIRSVVGLDVEASTKAFSSFLQKSALTADQTTFINQIISFLSSNGTIDKKMLFEPPFTNLNDQGLMGVFNDSEVSNVIKIVDSINDNALGA